MAYMHVAWPPMPNFNVRWPAVLWLFFVHLPHMTTVRWLPSRSTMHNNIAGHPGSNYNTRWHTVTSGFPWVSLPRVEWFMESLPTPQILLTLHRWCDENHKPPSLFTRSWFRSYTQGSVALPFVTFYLFSSRFHSWFQRVSLSLRYNFGLSLAGFPIINEKM